MSSIDPYSQYAPGWTYENTDTMTGWSIDSDAAATAVGIDTTTTWYFFVNPAAHRAQVGRQTELEGYAADHPIVMVAQSLSGVLYLLDGRTGEQIAP